jgi:hypothetical protein
LFQICLVIIVATGQILDQSWYVNSLKDSIYQFWIGIAFTMFLRYKWQIGEKEMARLRIFESALKLCHTVDELEREFVKIRQKKINLEAICYQDRKGKRRGRQQKQIVLKVKEVPPTFAQI